MTIDMHQLLDGISYWVLFWTIVNFALPPREVLADDQGRIPRWYNTLLKLVAYYGSLNIRQLTLPPPPAQVQAKALETAAHDVAKAADAIDTAKAATPVQSGTDVLGTDH